MQDVGALFRAYEVDYQQKSTDIARKITAISSLNGELRRTKIQEVESEVKATDVVIKSMELEVRSLPADSSKPLLLKVKEYKADLTALKEKLRAAAASAPMGDAARAELGLGGGDYYGTSAGQRERMMSSTQRMEKTNDNLAFAKEQLGQTEEMGASILQNLHGQRETIMRSRETLAGADDNIGKARKVLSNMARRALQNKIIMFGVAAFLLLGIVIIIWVKVKN